MTKLQTETEEVVGCVPRCQTCGSERVVKDAWACFNPEYGLWDVEAVFEQAHCHQCDSKVDVVWSRQDIPPNQRVRELNDLFRTKSRGNGSVMITAGVQSEGQDFMVAAVEAVRTFADFCDDNDPWGEHDFGAVEIGGEKVFFKIDYYDPSLEKGSENPANEGCTHRVLTIMLASEY